MNLLLFILSLVASSQVSAECVPPPKLEEALPPNLAYVGGEIIEEDNGLLYLSCPTSNQWIIKQAENGARIPSSGYIICIGDEWITETEVTLAPEDQFACVEGTIDESKVCNIKFNSKNQEILVGEPYTTCQLGQTTSITVNGDPVTGTKLKCVQSGTVSVDDVPVGYDKNAPLRQVIMDCVDPTTTTSTSTVSTTTTAKPTSTTSTVSTTTAANPSTNAPNPDNASTTAAC